MKSVTRINDRNDIRVWTIPQTKEDVLDLISQKKPLSFGKTKEALHKCSETSSEFLKHVSDKDMRSDVCEGVASEIAIIVGAYTSRIDNRIKRWICWSMLVPTIISVIVKTTYKGRRK